MNPITLPQAYALIKTTLETAWGSTTQLRYVNDRLDPPSDEEGRPLPFVLLDYGELSDGPITIGSPGDNIYLDEGTFELHVLVPSGEGDVRALTLCEQLRGIFRGKDLGGVLCAGASLTSGSGAEELGNYWRRSVIVDFWLFATG